MGFNQPLTNAVSGKTVEQRLIEFLSDGIDEQARASMNFEGETVDLEQKDREDGKGIDYVATVFPPEGVHRKLHSNSITTPKLIKFSLIVQSVDELEVETGD